MELKGLTKAQIPYWYLSVPPALKGLKTINHKVHEVFLFFFGGGGVSSSKI